MCEGRVCVVTGAGRGLGREYALLLARHGAKVVVNDSADVTGQVVEASGLVLAVAEGWHRGPSSKPVESPAEVGPVVRKLLADARPRTLFHEVS